MSVNLQLPIYLDYQSTTPIDKRVLEVVNQQMEQCYGNPHSRTHKFGWQAEEASEIAREQIASLINADPKDIVFTSGATESNNLAIIGSAMFALNNNSEKNHIITVLTEHKCVINSCRHLETKGFKVTYLSVQKNGIIDLNQLKDAITEKTLLISVMGVNNEIGVIQPLKEIGDIAKEKGIIFHSDCAQAFGKIPLDVEQMGIDMMSISGHKIYAPKGIGALYVRRRPKRVRLIPLIHGGGQERGIRSGTLPTPLAGGLGKAAEIAKAEMMQDDAQAKKYFDKLYKALVMDLSEVYLNGDKEKRYHGNFNASFAFIEGESMIMAVSDLAVSSGSACTSASLEPSYVIKAIGVSEELAHTSIRLGFGRMTTEAEIDYAINLIKNKIEALRNLSPLWEMHKDGIDITTIKWSGH